MRRGKKEARGRETGEVLRQNAIPFLIRLSELREPEAPTNVAKEIHADPKNAVALASRLAGKGLVDLQEIGEVAGKPTFLVAITPRGRMFLEVLSPAIDFLESDDKRPAARARQ